MSIVQRARASRRVACLPLSLAYISTMYATGARARPGPQAWTPSFFPFPPVCRRPPASSSLLFAAASTSVTSSSPPPAQRFPPPFPSKKTRRGQTSPRGCWPVTRAPSSFSSSLSSYQYKSRLLAKRKRSYRQPVCAAAPPLILPPLESNALRTRARSQRFGSSSPESHPILHMSLHWFHKQIRPPFTPPKNFDDSQPFPLHQRGEGGEFHARADMGRLRQLEGLAARPYPQRGPQRSKSQSSRVSSRLPCSSSCSFSTPRPHRLLLRRRDSWLSSSSSHRHLR